jgi:uncharacterized protein (DUF39 family)
LRSDNDVPRRGAATLAVTGDLKHMSPRWLRGASFTGYGVTLTVGLGIPIPILDEEVLVAAAVTDKDIVAPVVDYSSAYPNGKTEVLGEVTVAQLKSGEIEVNGKKVVTAGLSSYARAREVAQILKELIQTGRFLLTARLAPLPGPGSDYVFKPLKERPFEGLNRRAVG